MDTLISGATVVTMNEGMEVLLGGFVGITDGKIVYLSKEAPKEKPAAIVDGSGMVLLPGLINCHTHLAQTALRNFFDDLSPKDSLEALLRFEARMDSKAAEAAVTMGVAECLRMGITSVSDLYYYPEAPELKREQRVDNKEGSAILKGLKRLFTLAYNDAKTL